MSLKARFSFLILTLLLGACGPPIEKGEIQLDPQNGERLAMAYVLMIDNTGDNMADLPKICLDKEHKNCPESLGVYADKDHKIKGSLVIGKIISSPAEVISLSMKNMIFDDIGQSSRMRSISLGFKNWSVPFVNNSKNFTYYTAEVTNDGQAVTVNEVPACKRLDGIYMGAFIIKFVDKGMPVPSLAVQDITDKVHRLHTSMAKYMAQEGFTCYAIPKDRAPLLKSYSLHMSSE